MFDHIRALVAGAPLHDHMQGIAMLLSLVNPAVCALMFTGATQGQSRAAALRDATSAMLTVGVVLLVAAFVGSSILKVFGISLDAFSVAGGGVLVFIGISMLSGGANPSSGSAEAPNTSAALGKLILFAASPGTITGIITLVATQRHGPVPITAIVAIAVVVPVTWLLLVATALRADWSSGGAASPSLARDMISRYMGLIIVAMGIQFALTGFRGFMAG